MQQHPHDEEHEVVGVEVQGRQPALGPEQVEQVGEAQSGTITTVRTGLNSSFSPGVLGAADGFLGVR